MPFLGSPAIGDPLVSGLFVYDMGRPIPEGRLDPRLPRGRAAPPRANRTRLTYTCSQPRQHRPDAPLTSVALTFERGLYSGRESSPIPRGQSNVSERPDQGGRGSGCVRRRPIEPSVRLTMPQHSTLVRRALCPLWHRSGCWRLRKGRHHVSCEALQHGPVPGTRREEHDVIDAGGPPRVDTGGDLLDAA